MKKPLRSIASSLLCACLLLPAAQANGDEYKEIASPYVTKIEIVHSVDRVEYDLGDVFDPTGLVLQATYSDGSTAVVTDYSYKDTPLKMRDKKVAISYAGFSVEQKITVEDPNADPATICLVQFSGSFVLRMNLYKDQHFSVFFDGFNGSQSCGTWSWMDGKLTLKHDEEGLQMDYHNTVEIIEPDETGTMNYSFYHERTGLVSISVDALTWADIFGSKEYPMP